MSGRRAGEGYQPGFGVCTIEWHYGTPPRDHSGQLYLVEVWHVSNLSCSTPFRPRVGVRAAIEIRTYTDGKWMLVGNEATLDPVRSGPLVEVRRWATLPTRTWRGTVTLDGWDAS